MDAGNEDVELVTIGRPKHWRKPVFKPQDIDIASLEEVLSYENDNVVDRFIVDFDVTPKRAQALFEDAKRWLWLCAEARRETAQGVRDVPTPTIFDGDEQKALDDMWHTFILFTSDYQDFCYRFFGTFLHHAPTPEAEKRAFFASSDDEQRRTYEEKQSAMRAHAAYVYDKLGEDVARRWYLCQPSAPAPAPAPIEAAASPAH